MIHTMPGKDKRIQFAQAFGYSRFSSHHNTGAVTNEIHPVFFKIIFSETCILQTLNKSILMHSDVSDSSSTKSKNADIGFPSLKDALMCTIMTDLWPDVVDSSIRTDSLELDETIF